MNAVIMDNVNLGDESIVGALSFIKAGEIIPPRSMVVGNPAKIIKQVSDEMMAWKTEGTKLYQALPKEMFEYWKECAAIKLATEQTEQKTSAYKPWAEQKNSPQNDIS
jgi:carbonic anhydrase/acetyltransferase-like protein (isoleucine patch superfamily)